MDRFVQKRKRRKDDDSCEISDQCCKPKLLLKETNCTTKSSGFSAGNLNWTKLSAENLDCSYTILYSRSEADNLISECERTIEYFTGQMAQVFVFGKWHDIPRKQELRKRYSRNFRKMLYESLLCSGILHWPLTIVPSGSAGKKSLPVAAYGDEGMAYRYSNNTIAAKPWTPLLRNIRDRITMATGLTFNFVLINRYKDGRDHMGEHRDDEQELVPHHPIASLSLGQPRDFIFKHAQSRGKQATRKISPVKIELQHGCLLLMNYPTNVYWYHSLPPRKTLSQLRINMTFRKMDPSKMVPIS